MLPEKLLDLGARVAVPSTMNALSVDRRRWKELGSDPVISNNAAKAADAYLRMSASISFTCAIYLLKTAPKADKQIAWAESNVVVFANSVLGARTQKYPDYLDVLIATTGRAPNADYHTEDGRMPTLCIEFPEVDGIDHALYPSLGYCVGHSPKKGGWGLSTLSPLAPHGIFNPTMLDCATCRLGVNIPHAWYGHRCHTYYLSN